MLPKNTGLVHLPSLMSSISRFIYVIRGHKVMLDADLAELYGVTTKRLNEQVKRNIDRFPTDFMFRMNQEESDRLRSQFATSKLQLAHQPFKPAGVPTRLHPHTYDCSLASEIAIKLFR